MKKVLELCGPDKLYIKILDYHLPITSVFNNIDNSLIEIDVDLLPYNSDDSYFICVCSHSAWS